MDSNRDDFPRGVKSVIAARAGFRCSKPDCRALTVGPNRGDCDKFTNVGVASHITAASPGGPRFDPSMSAEERRSTSNGIWMCQTHAKEIDDDSSTFTVEVLRVWKRATEGDAHAMLGRSISAQALDAMVQVSLFRAPDGSLSASGTTNLPDGTKLWVELYASRSKNLLGQVSVATEDGLFAANGFTSGGQPHSHGWYKVVVLAHFNEGWSQSAAVESLVGHGGEYLAGRFAEPVHPELADSELRFRAAFECVAPPFPSESIGDPELERAITMVRRATLEVDGRESADNIQSVVDWFMSFPDLRERDGWSARALPNGAVIVAYSYWNGATPTVAEWIVLLGPEDVRYWNLYGKYFSWTPAY